MKNLVIRIVCMVSIFAVLAGYNVVLAMRDKDQQIETLTQQVEALQAGGSTSSAGTEKTQTGYKDGEYTGSAEGYGGTVTMKVTVKNGSITDISPLSHSGEDAAYWDMAVSVIPAMVEAQTSDVDTVSGATFSSTGIINAVTEALSQAL